MPSIKRDCPLPPETIVNKKETDRGYYHGFQHQMGGCRTDEYSIEQKAEKPAKGMASTQ